MMQEGATMATANKKVMSMVEEELRQDPGIATSELFDKALEIDKSIGDLSPRQFNALYPLQVKRRLAPRRPRGTGTRGRRRAADRAAVRNALLHFAMDIAAAEDTADVIEVIGNVDEYVEKVIAAAGAR
jgi:hypothetical protein